MELISSHPGNSIHHENKGKKVKGNSLARGEKTRCSQSLHHAPLLLHTTECHSPRDLPQPQGSLTAFQRLYPMAGRSSSSCFPALEAGAALLAQTPSMIRVSLCLEHSRDWERWVWGEWENEKFSGSALP